MRSLMIRICRSLHPPGQCWRTLFSDSFHHRHEYQQERDRLLEKRKRKMTRLRRQNKPETDISVEREWKQVLHLDPKGGEKCLQSLETRSPPPLEDMTPVESQIFRTLFHKYLWENDLRSAVQLWNKKEMDDSHRFNNKLRFLQLLYNNELWDDIIKLTLFYTKSPQISSHTCTFLTAAVLKRPTSIPFENKSAAGINYHNREILSFELIYERLVELYYKYRISRNVSFNTWIIMFALIAIRHKDFTTAEKVLELCYDSKHPDRHEIVFNVLLYNYIMRDNWNSVEHHIRASFLRFPNLSVNFKTLELLEKKMEISKSIDIKNKNDLQIISRKLKVGENKEQNIEDTIIDNCLKIKSYKIGNY